MLASAVPFSLPQPPSAGVVVIADIDGILRLADIRTLAEARPVLNSLSGSTIVFCSGRSAADVRALQQELGILEPFISDGGAALHIPHGYFCGTASEGDTDGFETIDFGVRRLAHAVRLIIALFRTCPSVPIVVGLGLEWRDRVLLREVDVPVVIRDPRLDQSALLRNVPQAHVTDAPGGAGLGALLLGHGSVGRA